MIKPTFNQYLKMNACITIFTFCFIYYDMYTIHIFRHLFLCRSIRLIKLCFNINTISRLLCIPFWTIWATTPITQTYLNSIYYNIPLQQYYKRVHDLHWIRSPKNVHFNDIQVICWDLKRWILEVRPSEPVWKKN